MRFINKKGLLLLILLIGFLFLRPGVEIPSGRESGPLSWWDVQSVDTMKFSRDLAREKVSDRTFDEVIEEQVSQIAQIGATHVAVGTPYDEEFLPILRRWVAAARRHGLKVWFRGNWSGWEGWFDYSRISREEHIEKTKEFILENEELFEDGDIFTPCPEAENGGPGDPRRTGDAEGHRDFLIEDYRVTREAFDRIGKEVRSNFSSMNGDVARLVMDRETTEAMDGVVVIDHYVSSVDRLVSDVEELAEESGGRVMFGEFGAPILDVHGRMTEEEQAEWVGEALSRLSEMPEVVGVNYWVSRGSSTELWGKDGSQRQAAKVVASFYSPNTVDGVVVNQLNQPVAGARISTQDRESVTDQQGRFKLAYRGDYIDLTTQAQGYVTQQTKVTSQLLETKIELVKEKPDWLFKLRQFFTD